MRKVILPSLTGEQVQYLIIQADNIRDKSIISLLADSGPIQLVDTFMESVG